MKCKTCKTNAARPGRDYCTDCWMKSIDKRYPVDDNPDPLDVCPYCGGPMTPNPYGMCSGCHRERQSYRDEWS